MHTTMEDAYARRAIGRVTAALAGLLYAGMSVTLEVVPVFDRAGFDGRNLMQIAAVTCALTAIAPSVLSLRVASAVSAVGAAGWRAIALMVAGPPRGAFVWFLVVVLEVGAWEYVLPPATRPPPERR